MLLLKLSWDGSTRERPDLKLIHTLSFSLAKAQAVVPVRVSGYIQSYLDGEKTHF